LYLTLMAGEDLECVFLAHRGAVDDGCRCAWRVSGPLVEARDAQLVPAKL
jgi:hypothetical protein